MNKTTKTILIVLLVVLLVIGIGLAAVALFILGGENPPDNDVVTQDVIADPDAIAKVTLNDHTVYVRTVADMLAAVDPSGNSQITLLQDISHNKSVDLPYSCTLDLAGFTLSTNPQQGIGLQVLSTGGESELTVVKNGTLVSYSDSVRVKQGAVQLLNVQIRTNYGNCVALYDTSSVYNDMNRIDNAVLVTEKGSCLSFSEQSADFSSTAITLANTQLISCEKEGAQVIAKSGSDTVAAQIHLEDNVNLYSYNEIACPNGTVFMGKTVVKEFDATATAGSDSWQGMTLWTTESQLEVINILMIGNSFCYSYVDELYGMAETLGYRLNITNLYRAGASIKSHWTWVDSPAEGVGKCEYYITGPLGRYKHPTITTTLEALDFADWDVISCQQHFDVARTTDFAAGYDSCMPYAANMFQYLKQQQPNAKLYWHETWAYAVGYKHPDNKDDDPTNDRENADVLDVATQTRQQEKIREVSQAICNETGVSMIPSGDAWQLARKAVGDTLTKTDYCHDGDSGGGQYLLACVWLQILTGESPVGNTWRPSDYLLMEEKIPQLQEAAHQAVEAIYG